MTLRTRLKKKTYFKDAVPELIPDNANGDEVSPQTNIEEYNTSIEYYLIDSARTLLFQN